MKYTEPSGEISIMLYPHEDEGYAECELARYCTQLSYRQSTSGMYGNAEITLELPFAEAMKRLGGVAPAKAERHLRTDPSSQVLRNLSTGAWIVIKEKRRDQDSLGRFFGQVTQVRHRLQYFAAGPIRVVSITVGHYYRAFMTNQLKQTLSTDDSIKNIDKSAIIKLGDFREGFLKRIVESYKTGTSLTTTLQGVISELGGCKLPKTLAENTRLGDVILVSDGSKDSLAAYGINGADADVIQGKIFTLFRGAYSNNITHHQVINQLFNAAPQLFEYIPLLIPITSGRARASISAGFKSIFYDLGAVPVIIYRYRPMYPPAPPTAAGIAAVTSVTPSGETDCGKFFNVNPKQLSEQLYEVDSQFVSSLECTVNEDARINYVFVESAISSSQGHTMNLARKDASPATHTEDINQHGLRAVSMHTPFISADEDRAAIKQFNLAAPNALAERLFHNIGMGHTFSNGSFTVEHDIQHTHTEDFVFNIPVGCWVTFPLENISETGPVKFTCYIEEVMTTLTSEQGMRRAIIVYGYSRGHIGVHAATFDLEKYKPDREEL